MWHMWNLHYNLASHVESPPRVGLFLLHNIINVIHNMVHVRKMFYWTNSVFAGWFLTKILCLHDGFFLE